MNLIKTFSFCVPKGTFFDPKRTPLWTPPRGGQKRGPKWSKMTPLGTPRGGQKTHWREFPEDNQGVKMANLQVGIKLETTSI